MWLPNWSKWYSTCCMQIRRSKKKKTPGGCTASAQQSVLQVAHLCDCMPCSYCVVGVVLSSCCIFSFSFSSSSLAHKHWYPAKFFNLDKPWPTPPPPYPICRQSPVRTPCTWLSVLKYLSRMKYSLKFYKNTFVMLNTAFPVGVQ